MIFKGKNLLIFSSCIILDQTLHDTSFSRTQLMTLPWPAARYAFIRCFSLSLSGEWEREKNTVRVTYSRVPIGQCKCYVYLMLLGIQFCTGNKDSRSHVFLSSIVKWKVLGFFLFNFSLKIYLKNIFFSPWMITAWVTTFPEVAEVSAGAETTSQTHTGLVCPLE